MRKYHFLLAIGCLLAMYSCQKETITPLPETTTITTESIDESPYFKINTLEDLATFEALFVETETANSRGRMHGKVIHVPNGSENAIQAAITEAGPYGLVVLAKGNHIEEQTIVINQPVYILGRAGATIIANSQIYDEFGRPAEPVFSIRQTTRVTIWGVEMLGMEVGSNTGVEILNSTHTVLSKNTIQNFQTGISNDGGDNTLVWKNNIVGVGEGPEISVGIVVINGLDVRLLQNKVSRYIWGIICGSQDGIIQSNELFGNGIGLNLDFVVPVVVTSEGNVTGSKVSATNWRVQDNYAHHNNVGYALSNSANNNKLINNRGGNNGFLDLILDTDGFNALGFPSPASFDNFVDVRSNTGFTIQDCGNNNRVRGGIQIPCN